MFVLVEMVDTVRIPPWQFERKLNDSIAEELNKKLANKSSSPAGVLYLRQCPSAFKMGIPAPWRWGGRSQERLLGELGLRVTGRVHGRTQVVYNVGLCICLFDITKLEDAYVFPGDGASHTKVHFRYVVFHPFLDEILIGKIKGCSPEGVHVSLGFFDDILIPPESLQQPAKFDEAEQVWVWEYETEEGAHDLYMDIGEEVRFRVVDESFVDTSPTGPSSAEAASSSEELPKKEAPYTLMGSISEPGLGLLSWWTSS
ncbi:DNA-directed RNA polymerase III subunit RPC8 isoform X1 [Cervus elaphus]|uniref:DNA-directed RNA polymerase III subunit RPC8 isoform X1 n=2 Tax=Cervus canadensis TaxID=1574408 RepID=UPI001CA3494F|nr:DNA-directed RNA polymerase III subunit RPC8 isoform X1 [Cervus canadensis]XP_043736571.1 DNA-directed RNA polymerase III subunit RPC8 isoform X1 [Cervus elaphus]